MKRKGPSMDLWGTPCVFKKIRMAIVVRNKLFPEREIKPIEYVAPDSIFL